MQFPIEQKKKAEHLPDFLFPLNTTFSSPNAQSKNDIPQDRSSLSTLTIHVSDQPSLRDHDESGDPSGSSSNAQ
jgi:hypothetical protein